MREDLIPARGGVKQRPEAVVALGPLETQVEHGGVEDQAGLDDARLDVRIAGYCVYCDHIIERNPDGSCPKGQIKRIVGGNHIKAGGYKVVQMKAKVQLETLAEYDAGLVKDMKLPTASAMLGTSVLSPSPP